MDEHVGDADGVLIVVVGAVEGGDGAIGALHLKQKGCIQELVARVSYMVSG